MEMEATSLEVNVMCCRDVKAFNFFQKIAVYVAVSIIDEEANQHKKRKHVRVLQRQKTPVDRDGDENPEWNYTVHIDLKGISLLDPNHDVLVKFEMRCVGIVYGNKTIGEVSVPLKDLIRESKLESAMKYVSYQVRTPEGKANGVLSFSYKAISMNRKKTAADLPPDQKDSMSGIEILSIETEKVKYPSLEEDICSYPLVDTDLLLPRIGHSSCTYTNPSTPTPTPMEFHGMFPAPAPAPAPTPMEFHGMFPAPAPAPAPAPTPMEFHGMFPAPAPAPIVHGSLSYDPRWHNYVSKLRGYDYGICGYHEVGQGGEVERFEEGWRHGSSGGSGMPGVWTSY